MEEPPLKKRRGDNEDISPNSVFVDEFFSQKSIESYKFSYDTSVPYNHGVLSGFIDNDLLIACRNEIYNGLNPKLRETDLFKVNQTIDLGNLDASEPSHLTHFRHLITLRDQIYSSQFRQFVESVTGCIPLSSTRMDLSCNFYKFGNHLLCHDDVIGFLTLLLILRSCTWWNYAPHIIDHDFCCVVIGL